MLYSVLFTLIMLCGALFYLFYRIEALQWILQLTPPIENWISSIPAVLIPDLPSLIYHSLPSFIGSLSVVLLITLLRPTTNAAWKIAVLCSTTTLLILEVFLGYFDWQDVVATLAGTLTGLCLISRANRYYAKRRTLVIDSTLPISRENHFTPTGIKQKLFPATTAVLFSSLLAVGSTFTNEPYGECAVYSEEGYCEEYKKAAIPVYMSYAQLRGSVAVETPRPPDRIGRLYLYADYVFLNEVNEGIHVINNTDPMLPVNVAFIRIPGNTEIAVRDNYLYADSYLDLITLDIKDPQNMIVIDRQQSLFPYDEYQNIPRNITFSGYEIERELGVVVSYRLSES